MTQSLLSLADKIVHLPREFAQRGNISIVGLLEEAAYFEQRDLVDDSLIREALQRDLTCVDEWLHYSADKRTTDGWYIQKTRNGFAVGAVRKTGTTASESMYRDRVAACAYYIKNELDSVRR